MRRVWAGPWLVGWCLCAALAGAQNARVVLRWKEVPGASAYELQIAKDAAFVEVVLQTRTTVGGYRWEQLPTTMHWWRVRSFDSESRPSEWSLPRTIAVDSAIPTPLAPLDGHGVVCGAAVKFEVEPSVLVTEYLLELATNSDFASARTLRSSTPVFDVADFKAGSFWWRTRGIDFKGRTSAAGPVRTLQVRVGAPKLKPVADVILGTPQVQLSWAELSCAQSYMVEATLDGRDKVSFHSETPSMAFKAGVAGEYRWRVAGVDERGTAGEWSAESLFRVRLPAPNTRPEAVGTRVELSWTAVPSAAGYKVELQRASETPLQANVTGTSWRSAEVPPGPYRWRVTARDSLGHSSLPSEWRSFTKAAGAPLRGTTWTQPPEDVVVAVGTEVPLSWQAVPEATGFEIELDDTVTPVKETSWRTPGLVAGKHLVRVRGVGAGFRQGPWSEPRELFAGVPPVQRAEVEQEADSVWVTLLDDHGRPIHGAHPVLTVSSGRLSEGEEVEHRWKARWTAPLSGADTLVIEEGGFREEHPLTIAKDSQFSVAARGGGILNGGAVASPTGTVGLTVRLPWFHRRAGLELRAGVYSASSVLQRDDVEVRGQAWTVPVSLTAAWHHRLGDWMLKLGAGPALQCVWVQVNAQRDFRALPGVEVLGAVSRALGPGRVEGEVSFLYSRLDTPIAKLNAGGVALRMGYVIDFDL